MRRPQWAIGLIPIAALLIGFADLPYGYYKLLRVLVFCFAAYLAADAYQKEIRGWMWSFVATALIYNPITPLALGRDLWTYVNVVTVALLIAYAWRQLRRSNAEAPLQSSSTSG